MTPEPRTDAGTSSTTCDSGAAPPGRARGPWGAVDADKLREALTRLAASTRGSPPTPAIGFGAFVRGEVDRSPEQELGFAAMGKFLKCDPTSREIESLKKGVAALAKKVGSGSRRRPAKRKGSGKEKNVDVLLGKVEVKLAKRFRAKVMTEERVFEALVAQLYSQHSPALAAIIKEELRVTIDERSIRRRRGKLGPFKSQKYADWQNYRTKAPPPSAAADVGPAFDNSAGGDENSADGEDSSFKSAAGPTVRASRADQAEGDIADGGLSNRSRGSSGTRYRRGGSAHLGDKDTDAYLRSVGIDPAEYPTG